MTGKRNSCPNTGTGRIPPLPFFPKGFSYLAGENGRLPLPVQSPGDGRMTEEDFDLLIKAWEEFVPEDRPNGVAGGPVHPYAANMPQWEALKADAAQLGMATAYGMPTEQYYQYKGGKPDWLILADEADMQRTLQVNPPMASALQVYGNSDSQVDTNQFGVEHWQAVPKGWGTEDNSKGGAAAANPPSVDFGQLSSFPSGPMTLASNSAIVERMTKARTLNELNSISPLSWEGGTAGFYEYYAINKARIEQEQADAEKAKKEQEAAEQAAQTALEAENEERFYAYIIMMNEAYRYKLGEGPNGVPEYYDDPRMSDWANYLYYAREAANEKGMCLDDYMEAYPDTSLQWVRAISYGEQLKNDPTLPTPRDKYYIYTPAGSREIYQQQTNLYADSFGLDAMLAKLETEFENTRPEREAKLDALYLEKANLEQDQYHLLFYDYGPDFDQYDKDYEALGTKISDVQKQIDELEGGYDKAVESLYAEFADFASEVQQQGLKKYSVLGDIYTYRQMPGESMEDMFERMESDFLGELAEIALDETRIMQDSEYWKGLKNRKEQLEYGLEEIAYQRMAADPDFQAFLKTYHDNFNEFFERIDETSIVHEGGIHPKRYTAGAIHMSTNEWQRKMFAYLCDTQGIDAAEAYFEHIKPVILAVQEARVKEEAYVFGKEHPVLGTIISFALSIIGAPMAVVQSIANTATNDDTGSTGYMPGSWAEEMRGGASENMSGFGKLAYTLGTEGMDFIVTSYVYGPYKAAGQLINTAGEASVDAYSRGGTPDEVFAYSAGNVGIDVVMDKFSLDELMGFAFDGNGKVWKAIRAGQKVVEGVPAQSLKMVLDAMVMQGKDAVTKKADAYNEKFISDENKAKQMLLDDLWRDYLGGTVPAAFLP